jgi:hypothetical protein
MEWGRCHWLDNLTRILQKFESGQTNKYLFFYKICKFTDLLKKIKRFFLKKILRGPVPAELGRFGGRGRPTPLGRVRESIWRAARWGPPVSGTRRPNRYAAMPAVGLSPDQRLAVIFHLDPSPTGKTLTCRWEDLEAHLGGFPYDEDALGRCGRRRRPRRGAGWSEGSPGCRSAGRPWRAPHRGLQGPRLRHPWAKRKGGLGW